MTTTTAQIIHRQTTGIGPQHETQVVAASLEFVSAEVFESLCCWCLDKPENAHREAFRVFRGHGECSGCAYVGRDVLVVHPPAQS